MKCVVMQPTFYPWAGYFNLMSQADCFVFFDDVQLEKQSWQTRNRILAQGQISWISVPVLHHKHDQAINRTEVFDQSRWRDKLPRQLLQAYARHQYRDDMASLANMLPGIASTNLAEINITLILECCKKLNVMPKVVLRSSELDISGKRTDRLLNICQSLGCNEYLSPLGAAAYLAEDRFCERSSIKLILQDYSPLSYVQKQGQAFISHLSIIDVVASLGWTKAAEYVRCGSQVANIGESEGA